ncbi:MAG: DEAD/DEAH box helicase, partial [Gammaproteobacteria bacterium]|nr:DEAD/DEAH box helicase [Gammaproteobacteria bacterium]
MRDSALIKLLDRFSLDSKTARAKGTSFEYLAKHYLTYDNLQNSIYDEVWMFSDWARDFGFDAGDRGIDIVAQRRDGSGFVAVQAKFYASGTSLRQAHLNGFIAQSSNPIFISRILVETTEKELSKNAQSLIRTRDKPFIHITRKTLEASSIDWFSVLQNLDVRQRTGKKPQIHQREALNRTIQGFERSDRGQLIMACGTGKTFTGQLIAENIVGKGGTVLVLVPSLALMAQTILEWNQDTSVSLRSFSVCSDLSVGKRRSIGNKDTISIELQDLALPATTDAANLAEHTNIDALDRMTVVFSTYQSIDVLESSQKNYGLKSFDLIICDEAHRTTGKIVEDKDDSNFVRVHDNDHIKGRKRLYMTATPRIFSARTQKAAQEGAIELCSMDDEELFGSIFYYYGFGKAVENNLLSDYRVVILALDEGEVSRELQNLLSQDNELSLDSATRILGCYKALNKDTKQGTDFHYDPDPMNRAMLFCNTIKNSKNVAKLFKHVVDEHNYNSVKSSNSTDCEIRHIDGTFNSKARTESLDWLETGDEETCHILSNVRCLGEGVDVPTLDAVIFMHPRNSQIEVVQAVGRVMRRSARKKFGYIILPIGIPAGTNVETALRDNKKYQVVWQTLNALRSHDERLDAGINAMAFGDPMDERLKISYASISELEEVDRIPADSRNYEKDPNVGHNNGKSEEGEISSESRDLFSNLSLNDALVRGLHAMIVKKCGSKLYWSDWASDIADIAQTHITRIETIIAGENENARHTFNQFLDELRDDLNPGVTEHEAVEMLAQHLITRPVFDAIFKSHPFSKHNSVSQALESVLDMLHAHHIEKESKTLEMFYDSVRTRASQVQTPSARQDLIRQLYDRFFQTAFKRVSERLGIVYTPVELVDYMLYSIEDVLQSEFGVSIGNKGVHVLDPFTGTGTFLARLIESDLIGDNHLTHKYKAELHANEILLLAYYIAGVNIEQAYYKRLPKASYEGFNRLLLTDTFNLDESEGMLASIFPVNQKRIDHQRNLDVRVIVGNPPYSAKQRTANDNAANISYPLLDQKLTDTYVAKSNATNKNSVYDSYIRAIKWASDRIGEKGVVAFVTNAGWLDGTAQDGMRKHLFEEYSKMWILNLRGNQRTSGDRSKREGGKIFGSGSRAPISINIFLKNPSAPEKGQIFYCDIGDYLSREEKLSHIEDLGSISKTVWKSLKPDVYGDWINQRDPSFDEYLLIGSKKPVHEQRLFYVYSAGLGTSRDAWCYNASRAKLLSNVERSINFFNSEVRRYQESNHKANPIVFVSKDSKKISWSSSLLPGKVQRGHQIHFRKENVRQALYRPFTKTNVYFDKDFNHRTAMLFKVFPVETSQNRLICVNGIGASHESVLMVYTL